MSRVQGHKGKRRNKRYSSESEFTFARARTRGVDTIDPLITNTHTHTRSGTAILDSSRTPPQPVVRFLVSCTYPARKIFVAQLAKEKHPVLEFVDQRCCRSFVLPRSGTTTFSFRVVVQNHRKEFLQSVPKIDARLLEDLSRTGRLGRGVQLPARDEEVVARRRRT